MTIAQLEALYQAQKRRARGRKLRPNTRATRAVIERDRRDEAEELSWLHLSRWLMDQE